MYAICKTELGDVAACLGAMIEKNYNLPFVQVGKNLYKQMSKLKQEDPAALRHLCGTKEAGHVINMTTKTIHKKGCRVLDRTNDKCKIGAYLVNPDTAGLKHCGVCMR